MATDSKQAKAKHVSAVNYLLGENSGYYDWCINDKELLDSMMNAKNGDEFTSDVFIMCNLKWRIEINPDGWNKSTKGSTDIFLNLLSFPDAVSKICAFFTISSKQTATQFSNSKAFTKKKHTPGFSKILRFPDLQKLNLAQWNIVVSINIHHIELKPTLSNSLALTSAYLAHSINQHPYGIAIHHRYNRASRYIYKINDIHLLNMIKMSSSKRRFESPIWDNLWRLAFYPNGDNSDRSGYFGVYLRVAVLPPFVESITVKYQINCPQTNDYGESILSIFDFDRAAKGFDQFMTLRSIQKLESLTFEIDIEILEIMFVKNDNIHHIHHPLRIQQILTTIDPTTDIHKTTTMIPKKPDNNEPVKSSPNINDDYILQQDVNNNKILTLSSEMSNKDKLIKQLQDDIAPIASLQEQVDQQQSTLISIKSNVSDLLSSQLAEHKTIKQLQQEVAEIPHKIDKNEKEMALIQTQIDEQQSTLTSLKSNVSEVASALSEKDKLIKQLQQDIAPITTRIDTK